GSEIVEDVKQQDGGGGGQLGGAQVSRFDLCSRAQGLAGGGGGLGAALDAVEGEMRRWRRPARRVEIAGEEVAGGEEQGEDDPPPAAEVEEKTFVGKKPLAQEAEVERVVA